MKRLHRQDLFAWSVFDPARDLDFNSVLWVSPHGNIAVDPVSMSEHDVAHARALGGVDWIVVTNSDHLRAARAIAAWSQAAIAAPGGEDQRFPIEADVWVEDGQVLVPGLVALTMNGSKTPGELALVLEETTLITGDLVRGPRAGALAMLPDTKLADAEAARASVRALATREEIDAVLVGDGWSVFHDGHTRLAELVSRFPSP